MRSALTRALWMTRHLAPPASLRLRAVLRVVVVHVARSCDAGGRQGIGFLGQGPAVRLIACAGALRLVTARSCSRVRPLSAGLAITQSNEYAVARYSAATGNGSLLAGMSAACVSLGSSARSPSSRSR